MTDVDALRDELSRSTKPLSKDYWDKQNKSISDMQIKFDMQRKSLIVSPEKMASPFNIQC